MSDDWVSVAEAARLARRSKRRIYEWVETGNIRKARFGRVTFIYWPDVLVVESKQKVGRPREDERGDLL